MKQRMFRIIGIIAAVVIALAGVGATANIAAATAPWTPPAQAEDEQGVLIVSVQRDGPAAKAGLRRGDIVLKINETQVNDAQALRDALAKLKPGDEVSLEISRGGSTLTLKAKLGEADGRAILGVTPFQSPPPGEPIVPPAQRPSPPPMDPQRWEELLRQLEGRLQTLTQTRVVSVTADSPAAQAGLQVGDVILSVNDTPLDANNRLADVIARFKPGDEVTLKIRRGNEEQDIRVTLGENPDKKGAAFLGIRYAPAFGMMRLPDGLPRNLPFLPPDGAVPFELPGGMAAVTIGAVVKDSPADKAGLKQGDVIIAANDQKIETPNDLVTLVQGSKPGDKVTLSVRRSGEEQPLEITVTLGENPDKKGTAFMGVSLGRFIRFERIQPGAEDGQGLEIIPGFRLPFDFGNIPLPQMPEGPAWDDREA